jgi:chemotaxis protein methyltransferase CheR
MTATMTLNEEQAFQLIQRKIYQETGLKIDQYKTNYLQRRIAVRMRANKVASYNDYLKVLDRSPKEYDLLLKDLTINVTEFFRDQNTFRALKESILPKLILAKRQHSQWIIRAWCAGCASGEEPYSLAMLFHLTLGKDISNWLVRIYGTDIDQPSLEKARKGEYERIASFEGRELREYFEFDGRYKLRNEIRTMVKFYNYDLISKGWFRHFDLILCRNVLIYFSRDLQEELLYYFHQSLNKDGYLILGKTESLVGKARGLFHSANAKECIYQKLEEPK